jgi:nucleotide-binding universal stress UspA family protein
MGTHGRSSADHDSLTERIIIESPCSVLTIGEEYQPDEVFDAEHTMALEAMKFLVPVDFSSRSRKVLDFAFAVGESMPHSVDLLYVVKEGKGAQDSAQRDREVEAIRQRLEGMVPESLAERATVHVRVGDPVEEILKTADEIDALCIVMGSHGKSMLKRFLFGTTTMSILHRAKCPVWFVSEAVQKKLARSRFEALDS